MDCYFLYIFNDSSIDEVTFVRNYVQHVSSSGMDFFSELLCSNISKKSIFCHQINLSTKQEKDVTWKEGHFVFEKEKSNLLEISSKETSNNQCNSISAAESVDCLADQLPSCGSFNLDVIISDQAILNQDIDDHLEFAASLHRLSVWHGARTVIVTQGCLTDPFLGWIDLTDAQVLNKESALSSGSVLWRGHFEEQNPSASVHDLKRYELRYESATNSTADSPPVFQSTSKEHGRKHVVFGPALTAIQLCTFSSIPKHLIFPSVFTLYPILHEMEDSLSQLLQDLSTNEDAALIGRLQYSVVPEKLKPDKRLSTSKWHKMLASTKVKFPEDSYPEVDNFLSLAITKPKSSKRAIAYLFRNTSSFNAQFYFNVVNSYLNKSESTAETEDGPKTSPWEVPFVSGEQVHSRLKSITEESENLNEASSSNGNELWSKFVDSVLLSSETKSLRLDGSPVKVTYEEVDPSDWPARVFLLHKQMQAEEEKKKRRSIFHNISPHRVYYNVSLSGDDIQKYFSSKGEAKGDRVMAPIELLSDQMVRNQDNLDEVVRKPWPDALRCRYADIYYNVNLQSEEKESQGNEMVHCFVRHETATTCNENQDLPGAPISVQAKYLTPRKLTKSTGALVPQPLSQAAIFQTGDIAGDPSNPVISTIFKTLGKSRNSQDDLSSSRGRAPRKSKAPVKRSPENRSVPFKPGRKCLPVRSSPRKKAPVNYKVTSSRQPSKQQTKKIPNDMPEIVKKKLRVAIASALETNDIPMGHALFRPCFKKLFTICQTFVEDLPRRGSTSQYMKEIADAHVQQVIKFEKQKEGS